MLKPAFTSFLYFIYSVVDITDFILKNLFLARCQRLNRLVFFILFYPIPSSSVVFYSLSFSSTLIPLYLILFCPILLLSFPYFWHVYSHTMAGIKSKSVFKWSPYRNHCHCFSLEIIFNGRL